MFAEFNRDKAKYETGMIIGYSMTILAFILFIPVSVGVGPGAFFFIGVPFLGGALYAGYNNKKIKEISTRFKEQYVKQELKKVFPNSTYYPSSGFTEQQVIDSKLLFNRDRFYSEDMIIGEFEGVRFLCSDVKQQEVRKSGKHTHVVTVFQGRFYEFDFPKEFMYNLLLIQPGNFRPFESYNKIKMESIQFNSELKVYAMDDHEAFYILTPQFMEKLLVLDRKYQDKISFSFLNNKLFIAIDTRKDYFDIQPFHTVDQSLVNSYMEEFMDIQKFITILNLNTTIFKKDLYR